MAIRINGDNTTAAPGITRGDDTDTGLQFGTDEVSIVTGGTEQVKVDDSGRLLVGTSTSRSNSFGNSSIEQLETTGADASLQVTRNSNNSAPPIVSFGKTRSVSLGGVTAVIDGDQLGAVNFEGADGSALVLGAQIKAEVEGDPGANDMPGRLVFSTTANAASSPTERMRIDRNGTVIIGDSMIADNTDGQGFLFTNGGFIRLGNATGGGSASMAQFKTGASSTEVLRFRCDGDIENLNGRYQQISDAKLKENIVDAGSQWDDIKNIRIRKYNLRGDLGYSTHTQIGVVAQEIELVCPGLVNESYDLAEDGSNLETSKKSVAISVLYMKAVKALQEAMERIETLETRLTALEGGAS
jgi:hypothetical protein